VCSSNQLNCITKEKKNRILPHAFFRNFESSGYSPEVLVSFDKNVYHNSLVACAKTANKIVISVIILLIGESILLTA